MKCFKFIFKNIEEIIAGVFICATVLVVIMNVILRYVFKTGLYWAEEVATICFVWSVFMGASATYKLRMNIGIDMLLNLGSENVQKIVKFIVDILLFVLTIWLLYLSIKFTIISSIKPTAVLGISSAYVNSSLVVAFGFMTIHAIRFLVEGIKKISKSKNREEI